MEKAISSELVEKVLEMGRMLLAFGQVERVTHHEDGIAHESDTTHSVMLGVMACAFAKEYAPHLDLGKIAQYALVHDLVEVYAGDTNTFGKFIDHAAKEEREAQALSRIKSEYDSVFPWIGNTIEEYESLTTSEARFVKVFDKVLPKIVHIVNGGVSMRGLEKSREDLVEFVQLQYLKIKESYGSDQTEVMELLAIMNVEADVRIFG